MNAHTPRPARQAEETLPRNVQGKCANSAKNANFSGWGGSNCCALTHVVSYEEHGRQASVQAGNPGRPHSSPVLGPAQHAHCPQGVPAARLTDPVIERDQLDSFMLEVQQPPAIRLSL